MNIAPYLLIPLLALCLAGPAQAQTYGGDGEVDDSYLRPEGGVRKLSDKEASQIHPHHHKGAVGGNARYDLYIDKRGNVFMMLKGGQGDGEFLGSYDDLRCDPPSKKRKRGGKRGGQNFWCGIIWFLLPEPEIPAEVRDNFDALDEFQERYLPTLDDDGEVIAPPERDIVDDIYGLDDPSNDPLARCRSCPPGDRINGPHGKGEH